LAPSIIKVLFATPPAGLILALLFVAVDISRLPNEPVEVYEPLI